MSDFNNIDEFKTKYIELLEIVINNGKLDNMEKIINLKNNINNEDLELITTKFIKSLEKNKKTKKLFLNRNERVFSNKNGVKLIPSVNLKTLILSLNDDGSARYIEVKTTTQGIDFHFFISGREVEFSRRNKDNYFIYRVFNLNKSPNFYTQKGYVIDSFELFPTEFKASLKVTKQTN